MKCDTCIYQKPYPIGNSDYEGFKCGHPDQEIAEVNNDAMQAGKAIISCYEYKETLVDPKPKQEEVMLDKAEEMRQGELSNA